MLHNCVRVCLVVMLAGFVTSASGCIPMLIGAAVYSGAKSDEDKAAFHAQNLEREKAGLAPMTWDDWNLKNKDKPKQSDALSQNATIDPK
jgi:hypothetical protein